MNAGVIETLHSGFTVRDVRRLAAFFRDGLGFAVTEPRTAPAQVLEKIVGIPGASAEIVYVSAPGHTIELLGYTAPSSTTSGAPRPCDTGFAHLSFLVGDVDVVARIAERFGFSATWEMPRIEAGPHAGRHASYLRDADGFTIEIMGGRSKD
jgi:catechol 2,3-dioxygenase-like lactoylglutathione lyase family enzyme